MSGNAISKDEAGRMLVEASVFIATQPDEYLLKMPDGRRYHLYWPFEERELPRIQELHEEPA